MTDSLALALIGVPFALIAGVFTYWWTRICIRAYRRWTR